jgi:hypothetical protein
MLKGPAKKLQRSSAAGPRENQLSMLEQGVTRELTSAGEECLRPTSWAGNTALSLRLSRQPLLLYCAMHDARATLGLGPKR